MDKFGGQTSETAGSAVLYLLFTIGETMDFGNYPIVSALVKPRDLISM